MNSCYLGPKKILKIYIDSSTTFEGEPLWEILLQKSKELHIAGATVYKGVAGFGAHSELHTFNIWRLKQKLPIIIEIIDTEEKIITLLEQINSMITEGLVTMSDIDVISYHHPKFGED
ncbi:MAG: DUF190 domain-containing protein [Hydrogenimonas sp.]|nr:MAG: DUF190 domain-containing protein [Hydrogenimonas sp.]